MKFNKWIIGLAAILLASITATAQTVNVTNIVVITNTTTAITPSNPWYSGLEAVGKDVLNASNVCVAPYGTLMTSGASKGKVGGGIIAFYDLNNYVAAGAGVDYMGQFEMVSGNLQLKLPIHPLSSLGWTNFVVVPNVIAGLGTPLGGAGTANSSLTSITLAGASCNFATWDNWNIGGGIDYGARSGAGKYSGNEVSVALTFSKGF